MEKKKKIEIQRLLKKIWNFQWNTQGKGVRRTAVRILAWYLIIMIILTFTSRTLRGITIPEVTVASAFSSTIDQVTEVSGKVVYDSQRPVYLEAGLKVERVFIREGQSVEEGTPLVSFQMEDLQQQIIQKREEAKIAKSEYQALIENQSEKDRQQQQSIARAEQDYERVQQKANFEVARAQEARDQAWDRYSIALNEGAESAEAQRLSYEQAQKEYEDTLWARESNLLEAKRMMEDAKIQSPEGAGAAAAELEWKTKKEELQSLKGIKKSGGQAFAQGNGIISAIYLAEGELTQESAALLIADPQGGLSFAANLTSEEQEELDGDGMLSVVLGAQEKEFTDLQILSRSSSGEMPGQVEVRASLPAEAANAGMYGTLRIVSKSQTYDAVVPLKALHQGETADSYYVFLVREEEGILGTQWKVQPMDVRIAEKNDYYAALTTKDLTYGQEIVVDTDKPLEAGDVVRLAEE